MNLYCIARPAPENFKIFKKFFKSTGLNEFQALLLNICRKRNTQRTTSRDTGCPHRWNRPRHALSRKTKWRRLYFSFNRANECSWYTKRLSFCFWNITQIRLCFFSRLRRQDIVTKKHKIRNILCFLAVVAFSYNKDGSPCLVRTDDPSVNSRMLYRWAKEEYLPFFWQHDYSIIYKKDCQPF